MAKRFIIFADDNYYHIYNRGVNKQPIFTKESDYRHQLLTLFYYQFSQNNMRYSKYVELSSEAQDRYLLSLLTHPKLVEIIGFCFMPNHYHLLIKQNSKDGLTRFMRLWQNSFAKYINIKYKRVGPLFQGSFKAIHIEDNNQLLHLSRYIHLNPLTSFVVKNETELGSYKWSSLGEYLEPVDKSKWRIIVNPEIIVNQFSTIEAYKKFVFDDVSYQQELDQIKHLLIEEDI